MRTRWAPIHFVLLGALLFVIHALWIAPAPEEPMDWVIDTSVLTLGGGASGVPLQTLVDDEILYREAVRRKLDLGDAVIYQRLVRNMEFLEPETTRDNRDLYAEARELGLDKSDVVVRRRLVERMRRRLLEEALIPAPTDEELELYLRNDSARFDSMPRVRLRQLFFEDAQAAAAAGRQLQSGAVAEEDVRTDAFPVPAELPSLSERELSARFGPAFATEVFTLPPDSWEGPLASAYGFHWVRVEGQTPGRPAELDAVRARVAGDWLAERETEALEQALQPLRRQFTVLTSDAPGRDLTETP